MNLVLETNDCISNEIIDDSTKKVMKDLYKQMFLIRLGYLPDFKLDDTGKIILV